MANVPDSYERKCFLCDSDVLCRRSQIWHLPQLGERNIGFSSCQKCGMVLQSPTVHPDETLHYYKTTAVYTKHSENYKPSQEKIVSVRRNIGDLKNLINEIPQSVFQVGCSDGYTLSQYRHHGASYVTGVDPSAMNSRIAKEVFGVDSTQTSIEDFESDETFGLVVLTHILEHLYDPLSVMKKCASLQTDGGWLLIEVPLLEQENLFPLGYLTFEHLNYFTEPLLKEMLERAGYEIHLVNKIYRDNRYPVVTVIGRRTTEDKTNSEGVVDREADHILQRYIERERKGWLAIENRIIASIPSGSKIYVWGAGVHTAQLLANTHIMDNFKIEFLVDSSKTKWGQNIHDIQCIPPAEVDIHAIDTILISTCASENEVYSDLLEKYGDQVKLVRLYNDD